MGIVVLYVCTGNVGRSPIAKLLLRAGAPQLIGLQVSTAGTGALVGDGIDRSSASVMWQMGIDPSGHVSRQFAASMARSADLVLTAERAHRDIVMSAVPGAFRRTFAMREFARPVRHVDPPEHAHLASLMAQAAWIRGIDGEGPLSEDDMPGPYRGPIHEARRIAERARERMRMREIVAAILAALGAKASTTGPHPSESESESDAAQGARARRRPSTGRRPRPRPIGQPT